MHDSAPRVLALETTGTAGSVAVLRGYELLAERDLPIHQRSAQSLAPTLDALLRWVAWQPADVELVAVVVGPGSFTGLRVGVTTAKMFAYATGAALLGIGSLETIAAQAPPEACDVAPVIDAGRGQFYAARYRLSFPTHDDRGDRLAHAPAAAALPPDVACVESPYLIDQDAWIARLPPDCWAVGPGLAHLAERARKRLAKSSSPKENPFAMSHCRPDLAPRATAAGRLAVTRFLRGERDDPFQLLPVYLRRSAAEEKRDALTSRSLPSSDRAASPPGE